MKIKIDNFFKKSIVTMPAILFLTSCTLLSFPSTNVDTPNLFKVPRELHLDERAYAILDSSSIDFNNKQDSFELDKLIGYVIHQSDLEACLSEYENIDYIFSVDDSVLNPLLGNRIPIYSIIGHVDLEVIALVPSWYTSYYRVF